VVQGREELLATFRTSEELDEPNPLRGSNERVDECFLVIHRALPATGAAPRLGRPVFAINPHQLE
jgi:hypothetical protein